MEDDSSQISPGCELRLTLAGGTELEGRLIAPIADAVTLETARGRVSVPKAEVTRLLIRLSSEGPE